MVIHEIELFNIGPYKGSQKIQTIVSSNKKIILIGGKNGSGKTSLLKSLKVGLFGVYSFGHRTETGAYYKFIREFINSAESSYAHIGIKFTFKKNIDNKVVDLLRSWNIAHEEIEEKVIIKIDNQEINELDKRDFIDQLKASFSPEIIDSMIFDGEKIGNIIENNQVSQYIEEVFHNLYGINLLSQLSKDILSYVKNMSKNIDNDDNILYITLINDYNNLKREKRICEAEIAEYKSSLNSQSSRKKSLQREFLELGGLNKKEREKFLTKLKEHEKSRDEVSKKIKHFLENDLPLMMNLSTLSKVVKHATNELPLKYLKTVKQLRGIISDELMNSIETEISLKSKVSNPIHMIDQSEIDYINERLIQIRRDAKTISTIMTKRSLIEEEYQDIKKKLNSSDDARLQSIMTEQETVEVSIQKIKNLIQDTITELYDVEKRIEETGTHIEHISKRSLKLEIKNNSFILSEQALVIINHFRDYLINKKLLQISAEITRTFIKAIRKNESFAEIVINDHFNIIIKNHLGQSININVLSAGEKQVLIASIIIAMFKIAKKEDVLFFDTPLARLDSDNRVKFLDMITYSEAKQIVLLSTDSEVIGQFYQQIKEFIMYEYLIRYDEVRNLSSVQEGYFEVK